MAHVHYLILIIVIDERLVLVLVEEEIFFCGIVGPDVLDALVHIAFVFNLLQVFQNL